MSPERTSGILLTILVLYAVEHVLALECYVCSSLESPSCSADLKDIGTKICGSSTTSSATSTVTTSSADWSGSTETTMSTTSYTEVGESSSSLNTTFATESSTDISTQSASGSTESEVTVDTSDYSETSSSTIVESSNSSGTEQSSTEDVGSTFDGTDSPNADSDSFSTDEPNSSTTDESDNFDAYSLQRSDPVVRMLHNVVQRDISRMISPRNSEDYVCYKIVYTKNSTSVTERGCYAETSSATCATLNENVSPESWNECTTCKEDGCNSTSTIRQSVTTLLLLLATVFVLIR